MKTKIATLISIAGVLVAGSAAALVNTHVLGGSVAPSALGVEAAPRQTTPATTAAPVVSTPVVADPPAVETTLPAPAPVATQAVYAIGDSGTVTLDTAGDVLTIVNVTSADGWIVTKSETEDATNVEVKFQAGSIEVEFHANLLFGVVTTSVESKDRSTPDSSVGGSGRGSDDDGDDDHGGGGDDD
ncbi:MAG: hypothetical protein M3P52_02900 [Actinomycetota bacterium]|nr:hypothetical protein [Actinomycetota bacterium]